MLTRFSRSIPILLLAAFVAACEPVDSTEHCVITSYGDVVQEKAASGINHSFMRDFNCFPVTQRTYPQGSGGENAGAERVALTTADSVVMDADLAVDYRITNAFEAFKVKREFNRVEQELSNAIRSGARNAGAVLRVSSIIGAGRATIEEQLKVAIQAQVGNYLTIERVYLRGMTPPDNIVKAWNEAALSRAGQQKARDAYVTDSLNARRTVVVAQAEAEKRRLEIQAMASSPVVLELEKTKAFAQGIAQALAGCNHNCIIGDGVLQKFLNGARP